ncbi:MAG: DUF2155 domain-containing protein [Alphaproteobacteria bacterium]|nr:DUF2155 domain-containing protein [Alphaproteobacteria bacterium]
MAGRIPVPVSALRTGGLALALLTFVACPAAALAQEIIPPSESPGEIDVPSLEEELGSAAPWRQTPPGVAAPAVPAEVAETENERRARTVTLNGLDKITGRIMSFDAPVDVLAQFGALQITARTCHKRPPEETPEISAYLEIEDFGTAPPAGNGQPKGQVKGQHIFSGWMFASSPALSALEHPIYDVWVMDCKTSLPPQGSGSE